MSESLFNFTAGLAANFLKEKRQLDFTSTASKMELVQGLSVSSKQINELHSGITMHQKSGASSFLFWYKNRPSSRYNTVPRYHVLKCKTMNTHSGYVAANSMPVPITRKNNTSYESLDLCGNCQSLIFKQNIFKRFLGKGKRWYDVVLTLTENTPLEEQIFNSSGYLSNWYQVSEAYRQSVHWRCENSACSVDLSNADHHRYLHTHHRRGTKHNSRQDLQALCLLCHAMEHPDKMANGRGTFDVQNMVDLFRPKLDAAKVRAFEEIMTSLNDRFKVDIAVE